MNLLKIIVILVGWVSSLSASELPLELTRFNPAGLSTSWKYEGTAFRAFDATTPSATNIHVLRLHHPKKGYLLTINESEATQAEKAGFIREGIVFDVPAQSSMPIYQFKNPTNDTYFYTASLEEGKHAGFINEVIAFYAYAPQTKEGVQPSASRQIVNVARYRNTSAGLYIFTSAKESPYQVGAFYFGSFSPSAQTIIDGTARVYGRKGDWWGGVKDFYGHEPRVQLDHRKWPGEWSYLKPAIGYYNQENVATLEKHIRQASDAGLSFFSFYWYWSSKNDSERLGEALHSFLKAGNSGLMKFNLSLYAHPWDDDMAIDSSNAPKIVQQLVGYFAQPNYLRLPDGRPVFVIGDDRNIRDAEGKKCGETQCSIDALQKFVTLLKAVSVKTIGIEPFVQVQAGVTGWNSILGADGVTCMIPPQLKIESAAPYPQFKQTIFSPLSKVHKPVSPCMLENFDERPRQDILISSRAQVRYLVGKTNALFRHNLVVTKQFSDSTYAEEKSPASRIIYLYAWNEWHEGGILEPNVQTGAQDLNIVTDVFQLPRSPSLCLDQGNC